ncbi:MAG: acetate--CoA ligase family protein [Pseudomonadota bacterium]
MFRPRSVAAIGGNWAENVVEQCLRMGFDGNIWPVSPTREAMHEVACYKSVSDLPSPPDVAFVGVNRHLAIETVSQLRKLGCGGVVCFASGFAESGDTDLQKQFVAAAGDMPVLGPNCYGIINYLDGALVWPDQHGGRRVERGVGLISQSSNIVINLSMQQRGLPIAYIACVGNQAQTGLNEIAEFMISDKRVTAIGLYIEGLTDAEGFAAMVQKANAAGKQVVLIKAGRTEASQSAIRSHTASLAGDAVISSAFFRQCGAIEVTTPADLTETLKILHVHGSLPGNKLATMSSSGGEAGLIADLGSERDIVFPEPTAQQRSDLNAVLGDLVAIANPLDYHTFIWGDEAKMRDVFIAMMKGEQNLTTLVMDYPNEKRCSWDDWKPTVRAFEAASKETGAPTAISVTMSENLPEDEADRLIARGIVPMCGLSETLNAFEAAASANSGADWLPLRISKCAEDASFLSEDAAKSILREAGLPVPNSVSGPSPAQCAEAGKALNAPLVLKGMGIAHKSEMGAVHLNLSRTDVGNWPLIDRATSYLLEEQIADGVAELMVGLRQVDLYGIALTIGFGGTSAELLNDTQTLVLPVPRDDVVKAMNDLKLSPLLNGYRGKPKADVDAAVDIIVRLAELICSDASIEEIEINPIIVKRLGEGAVIADALIRRRETQ